MAWLGEYLLASRASCGSVEQILLPWCCGTVPKLVPHGTVENSTDPAFILFCHLGILCRLEPLRLDHLAMRIVNVVSLWTFTLPLICLVVTLKCSIAVDRDLYRYYGLANGYWFRVHPDRHLKIKRVFAAQYGKCKLRNHMFDHDGCPAG